LRSRNCALLRSNGSGTGQFDTKIRRKNKKTLRTSRKIDAAISEPDATCRERRSVSVPRVIRGYP
jgi:hypothetical protein